MLSLYLFKFLLIFAFSTDIVAKERVVWVDIEGVPLNAWSCSTFHKIRSNVVGSWKSEEGNDDNVARKRLCIHAMFPIKNPMKALYGYLLPGTPYYSRESNGMIRFKKKLQLLKKEIRIWVANYKRQQSGRTNDLKKKLSDIDKLLDRGEANEDILLSRKRANLSVKGVLVDGEWVDDPSRVKNEFRSHFAYRFQDPGRCLGRLNFNFPNRLSHEQNSNLEASVSIEEVRKAVWGCGENKSPGPDGFTFEFFRKFWTVVGPDLFIAVQWFFEHGSFATGWRSFGLLFLFLLVMESFHLSLSRAVDDGIFTGIRIDPNLVISHLFYADDAVFIGECQS
ncbi:hypothetical protein Tco_0835363 [Tanacetum coccineum]